MIDTKIYNNNLGCVDYYSHGSNFKGNKQNWLLFCKPNYCDLGSPKPSFKG